MAQMTPEEAFAEAERRIRDAQKSEYFDLDLSRLGLVAVPEGIAALRDLETLSLAGNLLTSLPNGIAALTQLQHLNLSQNQLTSLPNGIVALTQLETLSLTANRMTSLSDGIAALTRLQNLYLSINQLTSIPEGINTLTQLQKLHLDRNQLTSIPEGINTLTQLEQLSLFENQLKSVPAGLAALTKLRWLFLQENRDLGLPPEVLGPTPGEVVNRSKSPATPAALLEYYFEAKNNGRRLNEVKLILVGRGEMGKTSLVHRLISNTFNPKEPQTPGICITPWKHTLPGYGEVQLNVWDFGGQEIMHGTHQFFLTERSLYLVVLAGRAGKEQEEAEYWLRFVQQFASSAPTIVVLNKYKQHPFDLNRKALREKFPFVVDFIQTDCHGKADAKDLPAHNGFGIAALKAAIDERLSGWDALHYRFPARWFAIKDALSGMIDDYISFDRYREICQANQEADSNRQEHLAKYLNQLGIALNFKDDPRLRDTHVLKPNWLTNGVYTLLNHKPLAENKGVFRFAELAEILPVDKYPPSMHEFLLDLMRKFDLCFRLEDSDYAKRAPGGPDYAPDDEFLLPERLPVNEPNLGNRFAREKCLGFEYRYPVWPEGLVPRFIVRTHVLSEGKERWRSGVVIAFEGCEAMIRGDESDRTVTLRIAGPVNSRRNALAVARSYFEEIHRAMNITPEEFVAHPTAIGLTVRYQDLVVYESNTVDSFPVVWNSKVVTVNVAELLNTTDPPDTRLTPPKAGDSPGAEDRVRVFVSYSHRDERDMERLNAHLKLAERQRLISVWYDRLLKPSEEWDPRILEELNRADIFVMLVSADFLASTYIFEKELPRALERHRAEEATAISVILKNCEWTETDLKHFQVLPKDGKPVKKWVPNDNAWTIVAKAVRTTADAIRTKRKK